MPMPSKMFNGEKHIRSSLIYYTKKAAEESAKGDREAGWNVRIVRSNKTFKGKYEYRLYRRKA